MTTKGYYPLLAEYGDRVYFTSKALMGEGTFVLAWCGIEEVWDVKLDNGSTIHIYPGLGETMVSLDG